MVATDPLETRISRAATLRRRGSEIATSETTSPQTATCPPRSSTAPRAFVDSSAAIASSSPTPLPKPPSSNRKASSRRVIRSPRRTTFSEDADARASAISRASGRRPPERRAQACTRAPTPGANAPPVAWLHSRAAARSRASRGESRRCSPAGVRLTRLSSESGVHVESRCSASRTERNAVSAAFSATALSGASTVRFSSVPIVWKRRSTSAEPAYGAARTRAASQICVFRDMNPLTPQSR